jgi:hypothetical protein
MTKLGEVYFIAGEITIEMEQWLERQTGKHSQLRFKKEDQVRLLKFRTWSMRYKISIAEILDITVPLLKEHLKHIVQRYGIGVPIKVLTGPGALSMLRSALERKYPGDEHLLAWREAERDRQLRAERIEKLDGLPLKPKLHAPMSGETLEEYIDNYSQLAINKRREERRAASQRWRRRKSYRGNPW